jgi:hypothetical protein
MTCRTNGDTKGAQLPVYALADYFGVEGLGQYPLQKFASKI